jgi:hypothetical protein
MDKTAIRDRLLSLETHELANTREAYLDYVSTARLDWGEHYDDGEESQAERARFLSEQLDCPLHDHIQKLEILHRIDFGPKTKVEEGAVVTFGGRRFVIAVATAPFSCDGQELVGISTHAPIYEEIAELRAGDTFKFRGREQAIEDVL